MATSFSRRQFIAGIFILVLAALSYYWGQSNRPAKEAFLASETADIHAKNKGRILLLSDNGDIKRRWPLPFIVHSVQINTARPYQIVAVEEGPAAALVDARSQQKQKDLTAPEDLRFAGHAVFSPEGTELYISAKHRASGEGFILVYDTESASLIKKIPSGGVLPHDLEYDFKDSQSLIVAHRGAEKKEPNLTWLSLSTQKVTHQVALPQGREIAEIFQTSNNDIFALGTKTLALYDRQSKTLKEASWAQQRQGEISNAYYDPAQQKLWLSLPQEDSILVVQAGTMEILKEFKAERPRSMIAIPAGNPRLLLVSVSPQADGTGIQRSYDLNAVAGSDEAVQHPRKFYALHAFPLDVRLQDQ